MTLLSAIYKRVSKLWISGSVVGVVLGLLLIGGCSAPVGDFLPKEIRNFKMGASSTEMTASIKKTAGYTESRIGKTDRKKIVWPVEANRYFKRIEFEFTEKDRLYIARFVLRDELKFKSKPIKEWFFDRFGISWENPGKMRVKEKEVILYIPETTGPHFFEITEMRSGDKWFEVFSKNISGADRPKGKSEPKNKPKNKPENKPEKKKEGV